MTSEPELWDVCASRHRGNAESVEANPERRQKDIQRGRILQFLNSRGPLGATCDEIASSWGTTPNAISGRFTELKRARKIVKSGRRPTRSGSPAAVYVPL